MICKFFCDKLVAKEVEIILEEEFIADIRVNLLYYKAKNAGSEQSKRFLIDYLFFVNKK